MQKSPLIFQRVLPHYRVPLFRRLQKELGYLLCYSREKTGASLSSVPPDALDFPVKRLPRFYFLSGETFVAQNPWVVLRRERPSLVVCECAIGYVTLWLLLLLRPFFTFSLVLWGHGVRNEHVLRPFPGWRGAVLRWLYRRADGVLVYSKERLTLLRPYLPPDLPAWVAPNSIDLEPFHRLRRSLEKIGKTKVREELGFQPGATFHLIWIGRLLPSKRPDLLLEAWEKVRIRFPAELHIVGDGPALEGLKARRPEGVKFYGAVYDEDLTGRLLYASDLFVMPGYIGLSILHAFSMGVPLLSCRTRDGVGPYHSPEISYLQDGTNGLLVDDNADAIADAIVALLANPERLSGMSIAAQKMAESAGLDPMVEAFREMAQWAENPPGKRAP